MSASTKSHHLITLPRPSRLWLPLVDAKCFPLTTRVKIGDHVNTGQLLAQNDHTYLHAPYAGHIIEIIDHPVIFHKQICVPTLVLDVSDTQNEPTTTDHARCEFIEAILKRGVIGMGGAGFSTALKCNQAIHTVLINAVECEPYISADEALIHHEQNRIIRGIEALQTHFKDARMHFCTTDSKYRAIEAVLPNSLCVQVIDEVYPSGAERTLIKSVLNTTLPVGVPSSKMGILCINVATVAAIADALQGLALTHRIVTVACPDSGTLMNVKAAIGTRISDILSFLNIASSGYSLSQGGPFMPTPIFDSHSPISKTTNCILLQKTVKKTVMPCIRCAACIPVCPEGLLPSSLYFHLKDDDVEGAKRLNLEACIACGACDAVCPSHIPLAQLFSHGKDVLIAEKREQMEREAAQGRFEQRESRLARLTQIRTQKREIKQASLSMDEKKRAIAEALARVKNKG